MSKSKEPKKKVVVTTQRPKATAKSPGRKRPGSNRPQQQTAELIFNKDNYLWMGIGAVLVIAGMLLMSGGGMEDPNVWDENQIYGFRRTVLAPMVILAGLGVEIYAIFKK